MTIALKMLLDKKVRLVLTATGLAALFFLSAAQIGMMVGWCNTNAAIMEHAGVDLWMIAEQTPAFDYGTAIPRNRIYQARSVAGVVWAQGMIMTWSFWERKDGRRVNVELIGLDSDGVGAPWRMTQGAIDDIRLPESVIVDELYLATLGVENVGDEVEMFGRRATVRGISQGVRTFTASPFVFTSIQSARKYDTRYRSDEVTYVLVRCQEGCDPRQVADALRGVVSNVEVLTTEEFVSRTVAYWMLGTGVGITVVITAGLGLLVSLVVTSQTLFTITQEHLSHYATLAALGFTRTQLVGCVLVQGSVLGGAGATLGSLGFLAASQASTGTPIPLEMTPPVFAGLIAASLLFAMASSFVSVRAVLRIDPVAVFRV